METTTQCTAADDSSFLIGENTNNLCIDIKSGADAVKEEAFILYKSCLKQLASCGQPIICESCKKEVTNVVTQNRGTALYVEWVCFYYLAKINSLFIKKIAP